MYATAKKITAPIIIIVLALSYTACGNRTDDTLYLRETISQLKIEQHLFSDTIAQLHNEIANLQAKLGVFDQQSQTQATRRREMLHGFTDALDEVATLLGVDYLPVTDENIEVHGNFIVVRGEIAHNGFYLLFRYGVNHWENRWSLIEYSIGPIEGSGLAATLASWLRWEQNELFTESFTMRFYSYDDWWPEPTGSYTEKTIAPYNWQQQVKEHMHERQGVQIVNLRYEGSRLTVDITPWSAIPFNHGSTGGTIRTLQFVDSLATLPNVTEIEVLVGGQRGIQADHFSFANVFRVNQGE